MMFPLLLTEQPAEQTVGLRVVWGALKLIWRHCNGQVIV